MLNYAEGINSLFPNSISRFVLFCSPVPNVWHKEDLNLFSIILSGQGHIDPHLQHVRTKASCPVWVSSFETLNTVTQILRLILNSVIHPVDYSILVANHRMTAYVMIKTSPLCWGFQLWCRCDKCQSAFHQNQLWPEWILICFHHQNQAYSKALYYLVSPMWG